MPLRITTWNVNGIRNPFGYHPWCDKRTFDAMFDILEADIVVMQELKIQRKDLRDDMVLVPGWDCYFSLPKHKKGYSGVAIYTRQSVCAPIRAEEGILGVLCPPNSSIPYCDLPADQHIGGYPTEEQLEKIEVDPGMLDAEGRCVVLEFPAFVIFGVYSPANSSGLRDDFRYGFLVALETRIRNLTALGKRVILTGDLNVSRAEIDTARADEMMKKEGVAHAEYISFPNRRVFNQLLKDGEVVEPRDEGREEPVLWDTCRGLHPKRTGMYTHWEQKINARPGNFGSRIDYVLCSITMKDWISEANIQEGLMGSDHCPVYATLKDKVLNNGQEIALLDIMNPPGMFENGKRLRSYDGKGCPAFCGKLLPEFSKRRNIKDMFKNPSSTKNSPTTSGSPRTEASTVKPSSQELQPSQESSASSSSQELNSGSQSQVEPNGNGSQGQVSPKTKRPASGPINTKTAKRSKMFAPASAPKAPVKGQQMLTGFFKPKTSAPPEQNHSTDAQNSQPPTTTLSQQSRASNLSAAVNGSSVDGSVGTRSPSTSEQKRPDTTLAPKETVGQRATRSPSTRDKSPEIIDPIVSKESWSKLFTKRAPPRCEGHEEPCISLTTKKPGINCGRAFWMCSRPVGPSGNKEKNTEWRCRTFIWASDWNGGTGA
ncbi:uncharacterized protein K452DRAFT_324212 [Aplosporella prunicola CBS 121167]|uniref:DNA-(apurinic or apyrimidinic site) endonuclease 2 n=1 Tax=Aplosporella prunicola CBS 121167 TaxID=1176127 RepID=A0A6A6BR28_9PEZI|nr:uncharacterized protein K452DRAFT_324212 [Aplosporella prunicola CBS 121167]KAF2146218.1 hypothetical protein K452DRAFT_324212 [Aplosporella prunicola CBS 121167]